MRRKTNSIHFRVLAFMLIYILLKLAGGTLGSLLLYPITLFVTFLHEFGHALAGILTGAAVDGMRINPDGSGYTVTQGGNPAIILMGGYLGSSVLGNVLLYIGAHKRRLTQMTLNGLSVAMAFAAIVWYESPESSVILVLFALALFFVANRTNWDQDVLMFLGVAAVFYILQDFNVGPKSDLAMYQQVVGIFPTQVWMYIWLGIAALLTYSNLKALFRGAW
ncbi:MAG: M50 family metallopeptidase [Bacteroidetes bacterium]|nr:M50 family metallopeptidase [Bacteroidota bacterium]